MREQFGGVVERLRVLQLVAAALLSSIFVYAIVVVAVVSGETPEPVPSLTRYALYGMAGVMLVVIPVVRRVMLGRLGLQGPPPVRRSVQPSSREAAEEAAKPVVQTYFTATLVGIALAEAIAIYGLALAFLAQDPTEMVPFAIVGLVAGAVQFPRRGPVLAMLEEPDRVALLG